MARPLLRKLAIHYIAPLYPLKPTSLFINPTLRCNSRCSHCTVWAEGGRGKAELSAAEWGRIMSDPFFDSIHTLWFSGGEPTLREDLVDIVLGAIHSLPSLESSTIATNALNPTEISNILSGLLPEAKAHGIYVHLHISLDGPPEIHDKIRGVAGAFALLEKTVAIVKRFRDEGYPVGFSFNCVIQADNVERLDKTLETAEALGGSITFNLPDVSSGFYRSRDGHELMGEQKAAISSFVAKLATGASPYHRRHYETILSVLAGAQRHSRCETLEATMYLDPDASVYPCPHAYKGVEMKATQLRPDEAWRALFREREKIRKEFCSSCALGCSFGEGISLAEAIQLVVGRRS